MEEHFLSVSTVKCMLLFIPLIAGNLASVHSEVSLSSRQRSGAILWECMVGPV